MAITNDETRKLSHLLRRAGFGARPDEWTRYQTLGLAKTTDLLLNPERVPDHLDELERNISGDYVDFGDINSLKYWWLYRMAHTQRPLEEKMTLFWHNHFATANYKVDNSHWMWRQNQLFRRRALGNFHLLLQAVSRDPAMLVWLDGMQNRKGTPNENYGRELLELFTMGIGGGYTETDVKEAARAFTGWGYDRDTESFVFDPAQHDEGVKTFLGQTGNFNGDDIIDIVVRHPSTARFLCTKLFRFFVHDDPAPEEIAPLIQVYFQSGYEVRAVVAAILLSSAFYAPNVYFTKIKSPAEYVTIAIRSLNAPMAPLNYLPNVTKSMGQDLFYPPNVKGWPEGKSWINTNTMLTRVEFASRVVEQMNWRGELFDHVRALIPHGRRVALPSQAVDALWSALLPGHYPSPQTRSVLNAYAQDGEKPGEFHFEDKAPGLITLILSAPEYQLA